MARVTPEQIRKIIEDAYDVPLKEMLERTESPLSVQQVMDMFANCDPTAGDKRRPFHYLGWIYKTHIRKGGNAADLKDLNAIRKALEEFHTNRLFYPYEVMDIRDYDFTMIKTFLSDAVLQGSEMIYDGPEGKIIRPVTAPAFEDILSKTYFEQPASDAKLVEVAGYALRSHFMREAKKTVGFVNSYMISKGRLVDAKGNEHDEIPDSVLALIDNASEKKPMLGRALLRKFPRSMIPEDRLAASHYLSDIKRTDYDDFSQWIEDVPESLMHREFFRVQMVRSSYGLFDFFEEDCRSKRVCIIAAQKTETLEHFDEVVDNTPVEHWQDPKFCEDMIDAHWSAIKSIPQDMLSPEIIAMALCQTNTSDDFEEVMGYASEEYWGYRSFIHAVLSAKPAQLCQVPDQYRGHLPSAIAWVYHNPDDRDEVVDAIPQAYWKDPDFLETVADLIRRQEAQAEPAPRP